MSFCQNCGKELLDEVKFCENCGTKIRDVEEENDEVNTSSEESDIDLQTENNSESAEAKIKKKIVLNNKQKIILGAALVGVIILLIVICNIISTNKYKNKLESAYESMTNGANIAESYATLQSKVWHNCIYRQASSETDEYTKNEYGTYYSDFNDALSEFYSGESLNYSAVSFNVVTVEEYMSELKDGPRKFDDEYNTLKELYIAYSDLTDLVIGDSSYSYNTFNETLEDAKSNYKGALSSAKLIFE